MECKTDRDCPPVDCISIRAPCPQNKCINGKCILQTCGNGICEEGEADYCPPCVYDPVLPCEAPCTVGTCPQDCAEQKDDVTCVFKGSTSTQECYSEKGRCKGVEACSAIVQGNYGEKVTWKSSCGGYAYTTIDGVGEKAEFDCNQQKCTDSDGGKDIFVKGTANSGYNVVTDDCVDGLNVNEAVCLEDGTIGVYTYGCQGGCSNGACIKSPQEQGFRNAEWTCADGHVEKQGEPTSCKTTDTWLAYAGKSCSGRCNADGS